MARYRTLTASADTAAGPRWMWALLVATGGVLFLLVVCGATREIATSVDARVASEESAFCLKLGQLPGEQLDSCLRQVSRLIRREQEIRSVEF